MTDDNTSAVEETIEHALRVHAKIAVLTQSLKDSMTVAGDLAGEHGCNMDYATFYELAQRIREADLPGRGSFTGGHQLSPPPGTVIRRHRDESDPPWPGICPCVYLLMNAQNEVIYVGKSNQVSSRMTGHRAKPWVVAEVIVCDSDEAALALEGDLIFQHQPELNKAGRWQRPRQSSPLDDLPEDEYVASDAAHEFAREWGSWKFDGTPAPIPGPKGLDKSLNAWIYGEGLSLNDLIDLIPAALDRNGIAFEDRWRYFCGVAWRHAREGR